MPFIGSVTCTFVRGNPPVPKARIELWRVPGLSGYGAQMLGYNDSAFEVTAVLLAGDMTATIDGLTVTTPGVEVWKLAIEALQGITVTIVNDLGQSFANCLILKVGQMTNQPAYGPGGIKQRGEIKVEGVVLA